MMSARAVTNRKEISVPQCLGVVLDHALSRATREVTIGMQSG